MAINTSRVDLMAGLDEAVSNQRVRAYVPGDTVAAGGATTGGGLQYGTLWMQGTGVATSLAAGTPVTITAAMLGSGIIVQTPGAATTWNLDTAANIVAYMNNNSAGVAIGDLIVCDVINAQTATAANTITINPGSGGSLDVNQGGIVLPINTSRTLFIRLTALGASPTYIVYA